MDYFFNKTVDDSYENVIARVTEELSKEGFGVLTEIDVGETLKKKIDVDFRNYRILGACNPSSSPVPCHRDRNNGGFRSRRYTEMEVM
jgi:uncharacterized protein (DUF302 family)